jgi:hypothetical protein
MKFTKSTGQLSKTRKFLYICRQFGFDPLSMACAVKNLPWYFRSLREFLRLSKNQNIDRLPTLLDKNSQSGSGDGHYFWQDLICARWISQLRPTSHFDVGSRIDGFIAHLLVFMNVTILDVRPLKLEISGLQVLLGNAQERLVGQSKMHESVSSLHSIEHFGLGRYGDQIDPSGHYLGLRNISECVKDGGHLYVSFPIGHENVEFNSQRVVDPLWAVENLPEFRLEEFVLIPWKGSPILGIRPDQVDKNIWGQAGLYHFSRI